MDKSQLRRQFCSLREALTPQEVALASAAVCRQLATWSVLHEAHHVLSYLAFRNEPDLVSLVELLPSIRWVVPRVDSNRLALHIFDPDRLVRHRFGMLEPALDLPTVESSALDLALVPGIAFDRRGVRLGFGGGFYDRFLPTTGAARVGIALDCCVTDELPCDEHDQTMDWVVTPNQRFRALWRKR